MKVTKNHLGGILFPLMASGYASFSLWEHFTKEYRDMTVNYALFVNIPVLVLSAVVIWRFLFVKGALEERSSLETAPVMTERRYIVRPVGLIVLSTLLVVSIDWVGYLIGFSVFTLSALYLMGVRKHGLILGVTIGTVLLIHFVFVVSLQLQLPPGPFAALVD